MRYLLGDGVPATLTAERIEEILKFAPNQKRVFMDALDEAGAAAWRRTGPDGDLYARIAALVRSAEGRDVFAHAKDAFERSKRKWKGRADLFRRLARACLAEVSLDGKIADSREAFEQTASQLGKWDRLAELSWAQAVMTGSAEIVAEALDSHPQIAPFLEDVRSGLVRDDDGTDTDPDSDPLEEENEGEVENLSRRVGEIAAGLDAVRLDVSAIGELIAAGRRLHEIALARTITEMGARARALSLVEDWRGGHADELEKRPKLAGRLGRLKERVDAGGVSDRDVEEVLAHFDSALAVENRFEEKESAHSRAQEEKDWSRMAALAAELADLEAEVKSRLSAIDDLLSESLSDGSEAVAHGTGDDEGEAGDLEREPGDSAAADASTPVPVELQEGGMLRTSAHTPADISEVMPNAGGNATAETISGKGAEDDAAAEAVSGEGAVDDAAIGGDDEEAQAQTREPSGGDGRDTIEISEEPVDDEHPYRETADISEAASGTEGRSPNTVEAALSSALERRRFGIAYHLALAAPDALPGASAIELVACNYVTDEQTPVAARLPELASKLSGEARAVLRQDRLEPAVKRGYAALVVGAALAPALWAPGGPVAELLRTLDPHVDEMPALRSLARATTEVSMSGVYLSVESLVDEGSGGEWNDRAQKLSKDVERWVERSEKKKFPYTPGSSVWRKLMEDNGKGSGAYVPIGHVLKLLSNRPGHGVGDKHVRRIVGYARDWRDNGNDIIDRIDRDIRNPPRDKRIIGSTRVDLLGKMEEAAIFVDRWHELVRARPDAQPDYRAEQAKRLRDAVRQNVQAALEEAAGSGGVAPKTTRDLVQRYADRFFEAGDGAGVRPTHLRGLLHDDLLADPDIRFDEAGRPSDASQDVGRILALANLEHLDFSKAAIDRAEKGDFRSAHNAIDHALMCGLLDDTAAGNTRADVDRERARFGDEAREQIDAVADGLDAAYARSVLPLGTFDELRSRLPSRELSDIDDVEVFEPLFETLDGIRREIDEASAGLRRDLSKRVDSLESEGKASPEQLQRVRKALAEGRFLVAEDFVGRIQSGARLFRGRTSEVRAFDRFFPAFVDAYVEFASEAEAWGRIRKAVSERERAGPVDATGLSADDARDGAALLDAWWALSTGRTVRDGVRDLMRALGFENAKVRGVGDRTSAGEQVYELTVADRRDAQLPDFGSKARGRYRIFAVRHRGTHEAIVHDAGRWDGGGRPPNIVLFFGVLDARERRALTRAFAAGEHRPTVVLDESLVAFLAVWTPRRRCAAFFDCASAFAFAQPFDPDAAEVPPEMFFGREKERDAIRAVDGEIAHFVYGGRRLGKTALFADIARHDRKESPILLIDLKRSGIGENRQTSELWSRFADRLAERKIVSRSVRHESFARNVKTWLDGNPNRRILFLVDEADEFLEMDGQDEWPVLRQVKALMDDTNRRFKVVFAGLHNVQRAARDPNTPFAHLGEAIRIGPMLPNADDDPIEELIRGPLEALGYRFASAESVIRIAAETNYYPALAQQYCKELLRSLRENSGQRAEGPPYEISVETVKRVSESRVTRDRIHKLFSWTIQLDPRYEFLAYLIAKRSFDNGDGRSRGIPIAEIRDTALDEWAMGFQSDSSYWTFEVLLEEMVGLGILRETVDREYAIRTRNLRTLLGNDEQIERRFADAKRVMAPATFDPAQFRRTLDGNTPSSLTADQERWVVWDRKTVGLVFGTRLAGLSRLRGSIGRVRDDLARSASEKLYIDDVEPAALRLSLKRASRSRKPGVHLILVDLRRVWKFEWIEEAREFVEAADASSRIVRPVFICGPREAWTWLHDLAPAARRDDALRDIWLGPCARGFARKWLRTEDAPAYKDLEREDDPVDSPWPIVAGTAAGEKRPESMAAAIDATLKEDDLVTDVFITPKVEAAFRLWSEFADDAMTADLLSDLTLSQRSGDGMMPGEAVMFFEWAGRLGIVRRRGNGEGYRLDSAYAAGLKAHFRE